jgi:hypothetical protein
MTKESVDQLAYWIKERQNIYKRKEAGEPWPWTEDPILRDYRFCNVYREQDRVTKFIRKWATPGHPNLLPALVLARLFNLPETLEFMGFPHVWEPKLAAERLIERSKNHKVFNAAYIVSTCGVSMNKIDYVFRVADDVKSMVRSPEEGDTLQSFYNRLITIDGMGTFLTGQVIADLKNTKGNPLATAEDWWSWCAPGPGSKRGLAWIYGECPDKLFNQWCLDLYGVVETPIMCMQDFQNCLCEFDKWKRTKEGHGKPKQLYTPRRASSTD